MNYCLIQSLGLIFHTRSQFSKVSRVRTKVSDIMLEPYVPATFTGSEKAKITKLWMGFFEDIQDEEGWLVKMQYFGSENLCL